MFDDNEILKDAGAVTSTGYAQVDSEAKVLTLGSGLVMGNLVVDVDAVACHGAAKDQNYSIALVGGSDESFTEEVELARIQIGSSEVVADSIDAKEGRFVLPFRNEKRGTIYPYMRVKHTISGTSPSINYLARLEQMTARTGTTQDPQTSPTTTTAAG